MDIILYKEKQNEIRRWQGGITRQLAIYPENREFSSRDFSWRLSTAEIQKEDTDFTLLPEYDRILMVLEGEVILSFEGERISRLRRLEQDRFGGEIKTHSYGMIRDFNLIYRKGGDGYLEVEDLLDTAKPLAEDTHLSENYPMESRFFYSFSGFAIITIQGKEHYLKEGETLVVHKGPEETLKAMGMGRGTLIHGILRYDEIPEKVEAVEESQVEEKEKRGPSVSAGGSFDDLRLAAYLSLTNFRGSRYLFKGRREYWNDPILAKAIDRLECTMATFLLGMVGVVGVAILTERTWGMDKVLPAIFIWVLVDIFLVNPAIYFLTMPKPIRSHRKKISELTQEEIDRHQESCRANVGADKILKKYKITGRNKYNDEE